MHGGRVVVECVHITAVGGQRQAAVLPGQGAGVDHGQHRALIDVRVVVQDIAGGRQGDVFLGGIAVGHSHGRVIGAGDGDGQAAGRSCQAVGGGIREAVADLLAAAQTLHIGSAIVQAVAVAAIGRQGQVAVGAVQDAGRDHGEAVADVHVAVVGQDVAAGDHGSVFGHNTGIGSDLRAVVVASDGDGQGR